MKIIIRAITRGEAVMDCVLILYLKGSYINYTAAEEIK
jgi:hypothetical protein